jgi:uncharacterized SAM-binding protein YcdF (DUF218 family)
MPVAMAEWLHWWASRQCIGESPGPGAEAIVVLGFHATRTGHLHPLQRWRTDIGVRSMDPHRESKVIFTGAGRRGGPSEAATMSLYAREALGVPVGRIVLETKAENTWQNIELTLPMIDTADTIKIASDPMHAARARRHLRELRPDLAARVAPAADYRFLERWWLKVPTAAYELSHGARGHIRRRQS